ncbi:MAG TPA: SDR family NAD(P)-dependent oxidoreductase [Steroidobacteraceae bacterium]|jgi:NAD(P)-dependent dehydrogenase (short-subunit alcohol dehydrogenase family)|nr:SDR family NAD(P)-dependent oxidoreductase [Steroidobacteraceae bacterium]
MDLQLKGRKAIVTGASRGIGLRIAQTFAAEGADVAICSRTAVAVEKAAAGLRSQGVKAFGDAVDVADSTAYVAWLESAVERLGGLDIFVHNVTASPSTPGLPGWDLAYRTDILGAVNGVETLTKHLRKSPAAAIVFIASISGVMSKVLPAPGAYAYGASKAALISYGAMVSKDLAKQGIRVNMVSPGPIYFEGGPWDRVKARAPQMLESAKESCVIGRLGEPQDIANAVAFLASPVSGFTVGQNLHVDGGFMQHVAF